MREAVAVFEVMGEAIMVTDADGIIAAVNPAFTAITGYNAQEAVGRTPRMFASGIHDDAFFDSFWQNLKTSGGWEGDIWNRRKNGELFLQHEHISAIRESDGVITKFVAVLSDVTEKRRQEDEIGYRANYDGLSGLANRSLLIERIGQWIKQGRRQQGSAAILFIDLDHFKRVNDEFGHAEGDVLLKEIADRLQRCVRDSDTVARLGGDEFVVLLVDVGEADDVVLVAEKIIRTVAEPVRLRDAEAVVGASIGIALFPGDGEDADTLFRNADLAMYRAKSIGRNNYQFFEMQMTQATTDRRRQCDEIRSACDRCEFEIYYRPIFDIYADCVIGAEALLRWNHPERGVLEPQQFLALAEGLGLIHDIDRMVIATACGQLRQWLAAGLDLTLSVAVNLSGNKVVESFSLDWLQGQMASHGLAPRHLTLEIKEKLLTAGGGGTRRWLSELRRHGFRIALDDFGTGHSSLVQLHDQPVDIIKVDRSLVADMDAIPGSSGFVRAILAVAEALDMEVVAEGVECANQIAGLRKSGCRLVQGYSLCRPIPAPDFLEWALHRQREQTAAWLSV
jgi:diguanylate cyclase (GGDEF)-like protein/PAS domain S-box-containing protein